MDKIADWMKQAIDNRDNPAALTKLHAEVKKFALQFPLPNDN
jgi:glycine/serine hydroxymethyltransferase